MSERTYYVRCGDGCLFEAMTKEETLTAITQAVESHEITNVDTGFVTTIKEQNKNVALKFWVGTQAEYNALSPKPNNTFCIITDDLSKAEIESEIEALQNSVTALGDSVNVNTPKIATLSINQNYTFGAYTTNATDIGSLCNGYKAVDNYNLVSSENDYYELVAGENIKIKKSCKAIVSGQINLSTNDESTNEHYSNAQGQSTANENNIITQVIYYGHSSATLSFPPRLVTLNQNDTLDLYAWSTAVEMIIHSADYNTFITVQFYDI